jgi:hypothetical protein
MQGKKSDIRKMKLINVKLKVTTRISENCIGALMNLRRVTNLEIIQSG